MRHSNEADDRLDLRVFVPSLAVLAGVCLPLILFPEAGPAASRPTMALPAQHSAVMLSRR